MRQYIPEHSSNVQMVEFDDYTGEMHVTFKSNKRRYTHRGLKLEHFDAMRADPSPGKYYWKVVVHYPLKEKKDHEQHPSVTPSGR